MRYVEGLLTTYIGIPQLCQVDHLYACMKTRLGVPHFKVHMINNPFTEEKNPKATCLGAVPRFGFVQTELKLNFCWWYIPCPSELVSRLFAILSLSFIGQGHFLARGGGGHTHGSIFPRHEILILIVRYFFAASYR